MRYMGETEADVTSSLGDSIWSILLSGFINCTKLLIEKKKKDFINLGQFLRFWPIFPGVVDSNGN